MNPPRLILLFGVTLCLGHADSRQLLRELARSQTPALQLRLQKVLGIWSPRLGPVIVLTFAGIVPPRKIITSDVIALA